MGLCLICKNKSWHSSYSGVSDVRKKWVQACLTYVQKLEYGNSKKTEIMCPYQYHYDLASDSAEEISDIFESSKNELIQFLQSLLDVSSESSKLFYAPILNPLPWSKTPFSLSYFGLGGLKTWIVHSDCDGYYSPSDCGNIVETFERIKDELEMICGDDFTYVSQLVEVFHESIETKSYVVFC